MPLLNKNQGPLTESLKIPGRSYVSAKLYE